MILIVHLKHTGTEFFRHVPEDDIRLTIRLWNDWNDGNVLVKPTVNCIFRSDQGESTILLSEIAGFTIGEDDAPLPEVKSR